MNKNKLFFIVLFFLFLVFLFLFFNYKLEIWLFGGIVPLVIWMVNKDVFSGTKWFEKSISKEVVKPFVPQFVEKKYQIKKKETEGLNEIVKLCVPEPNQNVLLTFIKQLEYNDEPWYELNECARENKIPLFIHLDWKESVSELHYSLKNVVKFIMNKEIELPDYKLFESNFLVNNEWDAYKIYDDAIKKHNLQLSLLVTGGDEYVLIIHYVKDLKDVGFAIAKLGYKHRYYE